MNSCIVNIFLFRLYWYHIVVYCHLRQPPDLPHHFLDFQVQSHPLLMLFTEDVLL
jgi:hypothetical protein